MNYKSKQEEKRRLQKLYNKTKTSFGAGAYFDNKKNRIIRYYIYPEGKKFLKRLSRRTVRRNKEKLNGSLYKRLYDYWYELL
ncbi:MAG: hypothetical protein MR911_10970 [Spirochaetia bacterium]|nr:hypothetical protein [Spirochaetia bacterium]